MPVELKGLDELLNPYALAHKLSASNLSMVGGRGTLHSLKHESWPTVVRRPSSGFGASSCKLICRNDDLAAFSEHPIKEWFRYSFDHHWGGPLRSLIRTLRPHR